VNLDGMTSEILKKKLISYCDEMLVLADKQYRSSDEVYKAILYTRDWVQALTKLFKKTNDPNTHAVVVLLEKNLSDCECIAKEMQKGTPDKVIIWARQLREDTIALSAKLNNP
jgi:hypothetical protein